VPWLAEPSSGAWLQQALAHPADLLIDHANCERKAAGGGLQLMFRYPCDPALGALPSPLAREELSISSGCLALLSAVEHSPASRWPPPALRHRFGQVGAPQEPGRMLDSFWLARLDRAWPQPRAPRLWPPIAIRRRTGPLYGDLLAERGPVTSGSLGAVRSALGRDRP